MAKKTTTTSTVSGTKKPKKVKPNKVGRPAKNKKTLCGTVKITVEHIPFSPKRERAREAITWFLCVFIILVSFAAGFVVGRW